MGLKLLVVPILKKASTLQKDVPQKVLNAKAETKPSIRLQLKG